MMTGLNTALDYRNPFAEWEQKSWIRSKPLRLDDFDGAPFPVRLVPLAAHPLIRDDAARLERVLAYRLLAHLQFTTTLELAHVNWVCSHLAQGQGPVMLSPDQRNDALRIYCDEGGHALFVELLSRQVEARFAVQRQVLGRPAFDAALDRLIDRHAGELSPSLIRLFFVSVSETLVTKILRDIPNDPAVATLVRKVIGDHAADEGVHSVFFHWYFPRLWGALSPGQQQVVARILPQLVWVFLGPDKAYEKRVLLGLGLDERQATEVMDETYQACNIAETVRAAAQPTLRMFEAAGVFASGATREHFLEHHLFLGSVRPG